MDTQLNVNQQRALVAKAANGGLGCIRQSTASRSREPVLPVWTALGRPELECCAQFWPPQYERDVGMQGGVQPRVTDHEWTGALLLCEEAERAGNVQPGQEKARGAGGVPSLCTNTWVEVAKKLEPGSVQWCPVLGQEASGTN